MTGEEGGTGEGEGRVTGIRVTGRSPVNEEEYISFRCLMQGNIDLFQVNTVMTKPVMTNRLVYRECKDMKDPADGTSPVYKLLGTVKSVLCHYRPDLKQCTEFVKSLLTHPLQWCVALLDWDASMQYGGLSLVRLDGSMRRVEDSLESEMLRMGMYLHNCSVCFESRIPVHEGNSKSMKIVEPWVDTLAFSYVVSNSLNMNSAHIHHFFSVGRVHSQGVSVSVYVLTASEIFSKMVRDIHCLWIRSFHTHVGYVFVQERQQIKRKF